MVLFYIIAHRLLGIHGVGLRFFVVDDVFVQYLFVHEEFLLYVY